MSFMLFLVKFIKFKTIIKFKKVELHNCGNKYQLSLIDPRDEIVL